MLRLPVLVLCLAFPVILRAAPVDYLRDIKPLLAAQCVQCHGSTQQKGGLRLDTARAGLQGGDRGPAIVPGRGTGSLLVQVLGDSHPEIDRMPYKRPPLDTTQTAALVAWIDDGAPHPADEIPSSDRHWAFVPPVQAPLPDGGASHPVDAFVGARLREAGLEPSPEADPAILFRRLCLDLTGLPPTPDEIDAHLADPDPGRYDRAVERLLASPHYGERWGRWWLDVARYADSNGYSIDGTRPIWPYRDWVIASFNRDLPFDVFTEWQMAGDLLAGTPTPEPGSSQAEMLVATGFHRNTQINHEGGIDPEQFRIEAVFDRVNTTTTAWLGVTFACAQCHDHKFDPFSQADYYRFYAYFNSTENDGHGGGMGPVVEIPTPIESERRAEWNRRVAAVEEELAGAPEPDRKKALEKELAGLRRQRPRVTQSLVLRELPEPRPTTVFIKGDFTRPGAPLSPGPPASLTPPGSAPVPGRIELARWLMAPENPLTARVTVNRVWQIYFGRGLVETENDFGTMGTPPTHPALLDWLAVDFRESGWSFKHLHRRIVTSATYRRSSVATPKAVAADPRNVLLGRQNRLRLDAELIRDVALRATGLLEPRLGGPPVFPPQPEGLGALTQNKHAWNVSTGGDRYRRAVYTHLQRSTLHPALAVFDAPDTFTTCTRRLRSNTPLQALTLLNDAAFLELAQALARRLDRPGPLEERLTHNFRACTGRVPEPDELAVLARLHREEGGDGAGSLAVARVLLNLDETITRE